MPWNRQSLDLLLVMAIAALAAISVPLLGDGDGARVALTLPMVLLLPGYALLAALLPARGGADPAARLVLSLGLSVALVVLGGLVLNAIPGGLHVRSWTGLLGGGTIVVSLVALARRPRRSPRPARQRPSWIHPRQAVLICLAVILAGSAVRISAYGAATRKGPGFTQLSIMPAARNTAVSIQVASMELNPTTYKVELRLGGHTIKTWPAIRLSPGTAWEATVAPPPTGASRIAVTALLYRAGNPRVVYRHVGLWLHG